MIQFAWMITFLIAILSALFFGAATPLSKPMLAYLTTYQLAGLLYIGAALGVIVLVLREGKLILPWRIETKNRLRLIGAVVFGGILGPLVLLAGLRLASAASVSMWLNLELVATAVLGHFLFRDHLTRKGWLAASGIFGASIVLGLGEGVAGIQAGLLVALACLCWGIDNHLTALIDGITPAQSTFWKGLVAGSTNLLIGMALSPLTGSVGVILGGLAVGMVAYGLSIVLYITAAQQLGATRSQLIFSSAPFWGILVSLLWLGERFTWQHGLAAGLIVGSISLLFWEQHAHEHKHLGQRHEHGHTHNDGHHTHTHANQVVISWHTHLHEHNAQTHAHPHWPDLHHRHAHD